MRIRRRLAAEHARAADRCAREILAIFDGVLGSALAAAELYRWAASCRRPVEHIIVGANVFQIAHAVFRNRRKDYVDLSFETAATSV